MPCFLTATSSVEWTSLGLLAAVLVAVGGFLRWWLPTREKDFETHLAEQQAAWLLARTEERDAFRQMLTRQQETFVGQWDRERAWLTDFAALEREHSRACLQQTQAALGELRDCVRGLRDDVRKLLETRPVGA